MLDRDSGHRNRSGRDVKSYYFRVTPDRGIDVFDATYLNWLVNEDGTPRLMLGLRLGSYIPGHSSPYLCNSTSNARVRMQRALKVLERIVTLGLEALDGTDR